MTETSQGAPQASTGWDEAAAARWTARDDQTQALRTPWGIAAAVVGTDIAQVNRVLDVASGPGGFLQTVLEYFPDATGMWFDFSETMRGEATSNLAHLNGRVEFLIGDIIHLESAGEAGSFDLVTTSRASHHLTTHDLGSFYSQAFDRLRPGGWIANLDILHPGDEWWERLRATTSALQGGRPPAQPNHPHHVPMPRTETHLACITAAGFESPLVLWRNLNSGLLMGRKPSEG